VNGVGATWFCVLLIVVAAVCVFPEVMAALSAPFARWIDSIYLPGGKPEPAPLSYRLVRYYQVNRQYDLAVGEYRRILEDYPAEAEAYLGLIGLLVHEFDERRAARRWLKRGLRRVAAHGEQEQLREEFGFLLEPADRRISA
jgi:tetratricopeptide (TPR) repeat protein